MGQRKSKASKTSYDVAPVASAKDNKNKTDNKQQAAPSNEANAQNPTPPELTKTMEVSKNDATTSLPTSHPLVPTWISEEYFIDIIKANVEGFNKITNFNAYPAMKPGENYATLVLRVSVDVQLKDNSTKNVSYMVKLAHDTEQMRQMLALLNMFGIENHMYFEMIPEFESMYKEVNVDITFGAKAYKFTKDPGTNHYVILQDLCQLGFKNANRFEGLNLAQTEQVLKKLAQLHAVSASRVALRGALPDMYQMATFAEQMKMIFEPMMASFLPPFFANLSTYKNGDFYKPHIEQTFQNLMADMANFLKNESNDFCVLNHGDCWINNMLFKYDEQGNVLEVYFIDFQGPKFGSPAQDIFYFLMTSASIDIKLKHFDYFIRYYHDNLVENLKLLKYPKAIPTLKELHLLLLKYAAFALTPIIFTLPAALLDSTDKATFENFMQDNEQSLQFKNALYSNKRYIRQVEEILPWLYNRGLL